MILLTDGIANAKRAGSVLSYDEDAKEAASYYGTAVKKGISKLSQFLDEALKGGPVEL